MFCLVNVLRFAIQNAIQYLEKGKVVIFMAAKTANVTARIQQDIRESKSDSNKRYFIRSRI